jgi:uncharacterized SAM-binding protein YcdF (DUF218 family)
MFFYLSKLAAPLTDLNAIIYVVLVASALLGLWGRGHWVLRCIGVVIGLMSLVMFTPLDYWLWEPLQDRFPVPAAPSCLDGIVVLSGGEAPVESARRGVPLLEGAPMRYVVLSDLMSRYPAARVIFTGGSGWLGANPISETDVARAVMTKLHLDLGHVRFDAKARSTWENAVDAKELAQPKKEELWALLAPASQMPRAVGSFRKLGWDVLPWPTDYVRVGPNWLSPYPSGRFWSLYLAEHEWIGLFAYWMTGRSSELFPGPAPDAAGRDGCP